MAFLRQPVLLQSAVGFVGDSHFKRPGRKGRVEMSLSEVLPILDADCFLDGFPTHFPFSGLPKEAPLMAASFGRNRYTG